jgi:Tol biopolymer transport system component
MKARIVTCVSMVVLACARSEAQGCATQQVSFAPGGAAFDGRSERPVLSGDARWMAFANSASNNGFGAPRNQVYLLERATGALDLVSRSSAGTPGTHDVGVGLQYTGALGVSHDGRFVLFFSDSGDLVAGDTNNPPPGGLAYLGLDVFLRDRLTGQTITPNRTSNGTTGQGPSIYGAMTTDARWIVFTTFNALSPADLNNEADAYLFDRVGASTTWVGLTSTGAAPNAGVAVADISDDGRYVLLTTAATNMVAGDVNGKQDAFVRDLVSGSVELVSVDSLGVQGNEISGGRALSPDGRFVLFSSPSTNWLNEPFPLWDHFLRDRWTGATTLVSARENGAPVNGVEGASALSADGRFVLFESDVPGVVAIDVYQKSDVFLRDTSTSTTTLVSATPGGGISAAHSHAGDLGADGRTLAFSSRSALLTNPGISNGVEDVFLRACTPALPTVYCIATPTSTGCAPSIAAVGTPSASAASGFDVALAPTRNQTAGLLFYGLSGSAFAPLSGRWLCVRQPLARTTLQSSGGSPAGDDCTGALHYDFNARIASGVDPALAAGVEVRAQYWTRDGGAPAGVHLSNALSFSILP